MKNKRLFAQKKIIVSLIFVIITIFVVIITLYTSNIYIVVSEPFGIIGTPKVVTYKTSKYSLVKYRIDKKPSLYVANKMTKDEEKYENKLFNEMKTVDDDIYTEWTTYQRIFKIDNYIYYFRKNDANHFYKYDTITKIIVEKDASKYATLHGSKSDIRLETEAVLDLYPKLISKIDSFNHIFYYHELYYDKGRIFFIINQTIYEYNSSNNSTTRIASVDKFESIMDIYVD